MNYGRRTAAAALALGALAACSSDQVAPVAPAAKKAATPAATPSAADGYIVSLKGNTKSFAAGVAALGGTVVYENDDAGFAFVRGIPAAAVASLGKRSDVADVQADVAFTLNQPAAAEAAALGDVTVTSQADPTTAARYAFQWNMRAIGANQAWAAGRLGSPGVTVAILDTGIDYDALDMAGLVDLSRSASFVPSDDSLATQWFPGRNKVDDFNGHGTNVATQVSSKAVALAGVTSRTTLLAVKVLDATGSGTYGAILSGMLFAADQGADVINMSLGGAATRSGGLGGLFNKVFSYAKRQGTTVVVSAGNEAADLDRNLYPVDTIPPNDHVPGLYLAFCDTPNVICVSAFGPQTPTGPVYTPAVYTNFGRSAIDVGAPGGNIGPSSPNWPWGAGPASWVWSLCPKNYLVNPELANPTTPANRPCAAGNRLSGYIGTSQASPHVAGLAALIIAETGRTNPAQVRARIQQSAVDAGAPGTDPYFGKGRIDVPGAIGIE